MERLQDRFRAAHTVVLGVSVDSVFSHAAWAQGLGGISFPLLADFHPKGEVAAAYGLYLEDSGKTDRATVIVDAGGVVRHASSVTPDGERDIEELAALCEEVDGAYEGKLEEIPDPPGLEKGATLYVKTRCGFSAYTLRARENVHLQDVLPVKNITEDAAARAELEKLAGKLQAPCLVIDGEPMFESAAIISHLVSRATSL